jgi:Flp pilus assembly protein TadD
VTGPVRLIYGSRVRHPQATAKTFLGWLAPLALLACPTLLALLAALPACGPSEPPRDPPLVADPPLGASGNGADEGARETELSRGIAYVKNEKFAEAKPYFEKAIAIKPTAQAWTYLGIADEKTSDRPGAEKAYKTALSLDPGAVEAAQNLAALYLDDPPRPDEAIAVLKAALAKTPEPRLYQNLGYALGLKGDLDAAGKAYEAALSKGEDAQIRFAYGALLLENKQADRAAEQLKRALDGAKDDPALLVTLGRMLGAAKAYGECVRALDRAIKIKATDPEWLVRRGTCKHQLEDEAGAQADYGQAIGVDPKFAAAHYYLGLSFLTQKNRLKATVELEKAEKLGADGPIGKSAREKLAELKKKK